MYEYLIIDYFKPDNEIRFKVIGKLDAGQVHRLNKLGWHYVVFTKNWTKEYSKEALTEMVFIFKELTI